MISAPRERLRIAIRVNTVLNFKVLVNVIAVVLVVKLFLRQGSV